MSVIKEYWSQIAVLIGLIISPIGYFIKRYFDSKNKLIEIKQSLHQGLKLSSVNKFIEVYTALESFYWQISYFDVAERKILPKELDEMQLPLYNAFIHSYYSLFLILDENELSDFDKIKEEILKTRTALSDLYDFFSKEDSTVKRTNQYYMTYTKMMENNEKNLRSIGKYIRGTYVN